MSWNQWDMLNQEIIKCRRCPRLVEYREYIARKKTRRYMNWSYWGKPVPGYGDRNARLLIVGLAPAAHGANRTGRMFTGDSSGDWLFKALYMTGFANQAVSKSRDDGLYVKDVYITAIVRCVPPKNLPRSEEIRNCRIYLKRELELLENVKVILCLGHLSWRNTLETLYEMGLIPTKKLGFRHGAEYRIGGLTLIASYHPSRQNTQTRRLTWDMWASIFYRIKNILSKHEGFN